MQEGIHALTQHVKGITDSGSRPTYLLRFSDPEKFSNILISVHYLPISLGAAKYLSFQRESKNTEVHMEYTSSAKNRDGECSSLGTAVHASGASK